MIDVCVGVENVADVPVVPPNDLNEPIRLIARVDRDRVLCRFVDDEVGVFGERP